ncbi:TIGR02099 family protein [Saccharospirillum sp. MSK14-1]|uniref:YhdP family protein n=1 Tax=Saccharospirillum sp. MSK14-1 TaxID=1897632 RepID=UPI000D3D4A89|nr:YhdP family protein [Saccharospirillum sp. MSK14-1]PTY37045.1 TIGR02099 family protein [Saccharospirillum sp. MSK14-1]
MIPIRFGRALLSALLKVFAFWVLLVAAYLALGRQFFPEIEHYDEQLSAILSQKLGVDVRIGALEGQWQRFNPVLIAQDVVIGDQIEVDRLLLEPAIVQSLVTLSPVFGRFELSGFSAHLEQRPNGWRMLGLSNPSADSGSNQSGESSRVSVERLASLIRQQRQVSFTDLTLTIQPQDLPQTTLVLSEGRLTGSGESNWLRADAHLVRDTLDVPLELQAESVRSDGDYQVDLYARHGAFDFAPWLKSRFPWLAELDVAGEYWLSLRQDRWQDLTMRLQTDQMQLQGSQAHLSLNNAQTELYLSRADNGFDLWVNQLEQQWSLDDQPLDHANVPVQARLQQRDGQWQAQWDRLPTQPLSAWMGLHNGGGFWRQALPYGELRQGWLSVDRADPGSVQLYAEVAGAGMQPASGAPGLQGLNGQLQVAHHRALLRYDDRQLDFNLPNIYDDPFVFDRLAGELNVSWWPGLGVQLASRHQAWLAADAEQQQAGVSDLPMAARWKLNIPLGNRERELGYQLAIEVPQAPLSWVQRLRPDHQIPENARDWIAGEILAGDFTDLTFALTTSNRQGRLVQTGLSLDADFNAAQVRIAPDWPLLNEGEGRLMVGLDRLDVDAQSGRMAGLSLNEGQLGFPYREQRLALELDVGGPAAATLDLFQKGPLSDLSGGNLVDWRASGDTQAQVKLSIPLNGEPLQGNVQGQLNNGQLTLPEQQLEIKQLSGELNYNSEQGLYSNRLNGQVFSTPYRASLRTIQQDQADAIELTVAGNAPLADWGRWLNDPWLSARPERTAARARMRFGRDIDIDIQSDLIGVPLALPEPLGKTASETAPLTVRLHRGSAQPGWRVNLDYRDALAAELELNAQNAFERGTVAINQPLRMRPGERGLFIDAQVDEADPAAWQQALQAQAERFDTSSDRLSTDDTTGASWEWLREVNLNGRRWTYLGQQWTDPSIQIQRGEEGWLITLSAVEVGGRISQPFNPQDPLFMDLDFLALPSRDDESDAGDEPSNVPEEPDFPVDPLQAARPEDIPLMNVQVAQLSVGERDLGSWRVEVVPGDDDVHFRNIRAEIPGAELNGGLVWRYLNDRHRTELTGQVSIGDIQTLLNSWGYAPVLASNGGNFELNLGWQGSPAFFDYSRLEGRIGLELTDGAILELDEYEGVKLVGLLNFTRVLRRLAFDFSDLINDGITYDVIRGELLFDRGFARVGEQLIIDGPATKFSFTGDADLLRDQIDVDMVMTVPLSSTFPLVALLAGVTPQAAAAIYVTERVFNNELERLSSARVHVTGSLDEPELRFYRVSDGSQVPAGALPQTDE